MYYIVDRKTGMYYAGYCIADGASAPKFTGDIKKAKGFKIEDAARVSLDFAERVCFTTRNLEIVRIPHEKDGGK